jgi:hypothetical protein
MLNFLKKYPISWKEKKVESKRKEVLEAFGKALEAYVQERITAATTVDLLKK